MASGWGREWCLVYPDLYHRKASDHIKYFYCLSPAPPPPVKMRIKTSKPPSQHTEAWTINLNYGENDINNLELFYLVQIAESKSVFAKTRSALPNDTSKSLILWFHLNEWFAFSLIYIAFITGYVTADDEGWRGGWFLGLEWKLLVWFFS